MVIVTGGMWIHVNTIHGVIMFVDGVVLQEHNILLHQVTYDTDYGKKAMLEREIDKHKGCPNRHHCVKDESKCCYLLSNHQCYLDTEKCKRFL